MRTVWQWTRGTVAALARETAAHAGGVVFTVALAVASMGFWLAWPPLGFIFPGVTVVAIMVCYRWRATSKPKDD